MTQCGINSKTICIRLCVPDSMYTHADMHDRKYWGKHEKDRLWINEIWLEYIKMKWISRAKKILKMLNFFTKYLEVLKSNWILGSFHFPQPDSYILNEVYLEQHPLNQHNSSLTFTDTHSEYINYCIHIWHEEICTYGLRKTQLKSYYDLKVGVYCGEQRRKGKWGSLSTLLTATTISGGGRKTCCALE